MTIKYLCDTITLKSAIESAMLFYANKGEYMSDFYDHPSQMEPMFPTDPANELRSLAINLIRESAEISHYLHPITSASIAEVIRLMNSYYSNLIEGNPTTPLQIEEALKGKLNENKIQKKYLMENTAHIALQTNLLNQIQEQEIHICSQEFLCGIHYNIYKDIPDTRFLVGKLRKQQLQVGTHIPPDFEFIPHFLSRFEAVYHPSQFKDQSAQIIAWAASHHRLAWIHPFEDGNGRVTRLFSDVYAKKINLSGYGLWTISRGFARHRSDYYTYLHKADANRYNDYDGRENLSNSRLTDFCRFFLQTALGQVRFMKNTLDIDTILLRWNTLIKELISLEKLPDYAGRVMELMFLKGQLTRKEIRDIIHKAERTARYLYKTLENLEIIVSESERQPYRCHFPVKYHGRLFPRLF